MKYEDYKKLPFLWYPRNNVPGATDTLSCITTAKGDTEIFTDQKGPDTIRVDPGHSSGTRSAGSCWVRHRPQAADSAAVWGLHRRLAGVFGGEGNPGA